MKKSFNELSKSELIELFKENINKSSIMIMNHHYYLYVQHYY